MSTRIEHTTEEKEGVVIRFAGDSGDGMQLLGDRFTSATAILGNDLVTLPDFPAEIRAPAGTLAGVSAFQIHFAGSRHRHPGRRAQRPGRAEPGGNARQHRRLQKGGVLIVNADAFTERNLEKAGYSAEPAGGWLARRATRCSRLR